MNPFILTSWIPGPLLGEPWGIEALHYINSAAGTRQGMVLFGSVGMLLALCIIWHRH